jgi:hypothetical protein
VPLGGLLRLGEEAEQLGARVLAVLGVAAHDREAGPAGGDLLLLALLGEHVGGADLEHALGRGGLTGQGRGRPAPARGQARGEVGARVLGEIAEAVVVDELPHPLEPFDAGLVGDRDGEVLGRVRPAEAPDVGLAVPGVRAEGDRGQGPALDLDLRELGRELGEVLPGLGPLLGQPRLDVAGLVVVEERGRAGEGHHEGLAGGLALGDVVLDVDVEVPLVVEVAVERGERIGAVELEPLHLGEADDVRDGAGLEGRGELLVEVRVGADGLGDRDDLVLGLVEGRELRGEDLVVGAGEGRPEQDRGAALVLRGDGEVGLGEAVADTALPAVAAAVRGAAGGESGGTGAEAEGGHEGASGEVQGAAGHGRRSLERAGPGGSGADVRDFRVVRGSSGRAGPGPVASARSGGFVGRSAVRRDPSGGSASGAAPPVGLTSWRRRRGRR